MTVWSRIAIVATVLILPMVVFVASGFRIGSASAHAWLPEGRPERTRYERFVKAFGSDQYLIASWDGCRLDDDRVSLFMDRLVAMDEVSDPIIHSLQNTQQVLEFLTRPPLSLTEREAANRLRGSMIGEDGTTAVFVRFTNRGIANQKLAVDMVRRAADSVPKLGASSLRMVGSIYEGYAVDEAAGNSLKRLVIPSSILGIALAWFCLHSVRAAITVLIIAGFGQLLSVALVTATGGEFSAVLIVLPTLVFMLTLSAAVHFMNYYADVAYGSRDHLGARAILLGFKPSILATLTTAMGMASLATSQLSPVRTFGIYSAASLCLAAFFLFFLFPQLADWFCRKEFIARHANDRILESDDAADGESPEQAPVAEWSTRYVDFIDKRKYWICTGGLAMILFSFYGLLHLQSSTKFDDMFPRESETVRSMAWIEQHLGPIASVEVMLRFSKVDSIDTFDQLVWVERVTEQLRAKPEIGGVMSATTFLPKLPTGGRVRDVAKRTIFRRELRKSLPALEDRGVVASNVDETIWRITAKVSALSKLNYGQLTQKVSDAVSNVQVNSTLPFRAEFTGLSPIMHDTQLALLDDLGASFTTAFLLILPVMILIARSVRAGLLIMIPNVLPETLVFGGMAWLGFSIDIAGILTASVAMGIAVNDTLHFINWYSHRLTLGDTRNAAIAHTFSNCARPMVHTMLISCCSMLPFMFAEFNPTRQFAMLMIAMMSSSILGDLVLLPALLLSPFGRPKHEPDTLAPQQ
jgi:predicted RND superfamily exporter protein